MLELVNTGLSFPLSVQAVEPLGPNQLVHGLVGVKTFTALTPELDFTTQESLTLNVAKQHLHLFDEAGKRLLADTNVLAQAS